MTDHGNPTTVAAGAGRGSVDAPSERILYMVGNAHIDPVWLWQWQEGLQEVRATFSSALERMDEYDDFVFTADSVAYLEWVERVDPELFARITGPRKTGPFRRRGRLVDRTGLQPPTRGILRPPSPVRAAFPRDRFGAVATVGCNVDPFGHAATLPQLLSKAGLETYIFLRPQPKEKTLPGEVFWWVAADGSRVLAYRIPYAYCSPGEDLGTFLEHVIRQSPLRPSELMVFYGVGNHGGGPTRANLDSIKRLNAANNGLELRLSAPGDYFVAVAAREDIPTYVGDLQHHAVGCYSAHSGVKRWNRRAEHLLMSAERWSAVAAALGGPAYPAQALTEAWKLVLFNQFHDTLAGTTISPAYDDARDQIGHASSIAADAMNLAAQSVSRRIAISPEEGTASRRVQPGDVAGPGGRRIRGRSGRHSRGQGQRRLRTRSLRGGKRRRGCGPANPLARRAGWPAPAPSTFHGTPRPWLPDLPAEAPHRRQVTVCRRRSDRNGP